MRQKILNIEGQEIQILESGGSGQTIFACHGNSSAADSFQPLLEGELGRRHRVVAISFLGHGGSAPANDPAQGYSLAGLGALVKGVIQSYGCSRYWLMGQSLGGHVLTQELASLPSALGLLLISAPPVSLSTLGLAFRPDPSEGKLFTAELGATDIDDLARCFTVQTDGPLIQRIKDNIRRTDPVFRPSLGASLAQGTMGDELEVLATVDTPVAVFGGSQDRFLNPEYFASLPSRRLWGGQAMMFPECGHLLHLEAPERFSDAALEFFGTATSQEKSGHELADMEQV